MKLFKSVSLLLNLVLVSGLFSSIVHAAQVNKKLNFFETVLSQVDSSNNNPIIYSKASDDPVYNWLSSQSHTLYFGPISPKDIAASYSSAKIAIMKHNQIKMFELVENRHRQFNLNELLAVIDKNIAAFSFEDALSAAKAFRHLENDIAATNHPLGDFVSFYILNSKIQSSMANNIELPRSWLSNAYYEMSQGYSHQLDYRGKQWDDQNRLHLYNEITDNQQRILFTSQPIALLIPVPFAHILSRKLVLLSYALRNDINNHLPWVRAIEFATYDLPAYEACGFLNKNQLGLSYDLDTREIENIVAEKFGEFCADGLKDSFVPIKKEAIKPRLLPVAKRIMQEKIAEKLAQKAAGKIMKQKEIRNSRSKAQNQYGRSKTQKNDQQNVNENTTPSQINAQTTI